MSEAEDRDLLAAEYVLGVLDEPAAAAVRQRLDGNDPALAAAVAWWEERLLPLAATVPATTPPADLWDRIAATTAAPASATIVPLPLHRRLRFWQTSTAGALAIAAALAAFILLRRPEPPLIAVLSPLTGGSPVLLATADPGGSLTLRPNGAITVPSDRDLELWELPKGETRPRSLGVLPAAGRHLVASLSQDTQLLVSLEPHGGSPTGQPTGPVLYGGRLTVAN